MNRRPKRNLPRIGISRCLLGEEVRYNGGHKRDSFLADTLSRYVEWVPVCPEVEAGLGIPREPMRLTGDARKPRLITISSRHDLTATLEDFSRRRVRGLQILALCGYVLKSASPSCGLNGVPIYGRHGKQSRSGVGLFARALRANFPLLPIAEENALQNASLRDNFLTRVFSYARWQKALRKGMTVNAILRFHAAHKYLLLAHSPSHYRRLVRLVGNATAYAPLELARQYSALLMEALRRRPTARKHVTVLRQCLKECESKLSERERQGVKTALHTYFYPYPLELMSRRARSSPIRQVGVRQA